MGRARMMIMAAASHNAPLSTSKPLPPSLPTPKIRIHRSLKTKCDAALKSVIDDSQMDSLEI